MQVLSQDEINEVSGGTTSLPPNVSATIAMLVAMGCGGAAVGVGGAIVGSLGAIAIGIGCGLTAIIGGIALTFALRS